MSQPGRFGPFLLFRETGSNSYRSCYRAGITSGRAIERIVRLEVYDQPGFDPSELLIQLERSVELQSKLRDPHIAGGAGVGHVEGTPWVAYEFELGTTLSEFLVATRERAFPIPLDQALFIAERVALALAAAHRLEGAGGGVLHSFLTPDTVLLSNVGEVKVCGFEVGRALREGLAGEPFAAPYLSSECRDRQAPRAQDDVFSLGSLLFELVTGKPISPDSADLDDAILQSTGDPVPHGLASLLRSSLAPLPERIPDVQDWQRAVGKLILDGDYNPTTFNLAFMMHTVLREPLERGVESLEREKRFVLPAGDNDAAPPPATASSDATTRASASGKQEVTLTPETGGLDPTRTRNDLPTRVHEDRKPFWAGFSISVLVASAVVAGLMLLGGGSKSAPARTAEPLAPSPEPAATTDRSTQNAARPAVIEREATPDLVRTQVVQGQVAEAANDLDVQKMVDERAAEIERSLAAEYEQKLEDLRREMIAKESLAEPSRERPEVSETRTPVRAIEPSTRRPADDAEPIASPLEPEPDGLVSQAIGSTGERSGDPLVDQPSEPTPSNPSRAIEPPSAEPALRVPDSVVPARPLPAPVELSEPDEAPRASTDSSPPVETPPRLLRLSPPTYPPAARRFGLSATARVQVVITPEGRVGGAEILGPELGNGFDRAALAAVQRSKWTPATRDGEPVEATSVVTLEFKP